MPTEDEIKKMLRRLGVKTSNRGYSYISYGVSLTLKDKSYLEYITKTLYVDIASNFNTSGSCVERDIRTTVEAIWNTDDTELLLELCDGISMPRRPANKKFFEMMYDYFTKIPDSSTDRLYAELPTGFSCNKLGEPCPQLQTVYEELFRLRKENEHLTKLVQELQNRK